MESNNKEKLALILGGITFLLFASQPYILDLIEPAKSIGQIIGENAKELIEGLNGEKSNGANSKREIWSNILSVLSFVLFAVTLFFSMNAIQNDSSKWYGVGGGLLSILGLGVYFFHLAIGFFGFVVLAILIVGLVLFSEFI